MGQLLRSIFSIGGTQGQNADENKVEDLITSAEVSEKYKDIKERKKGTEAIKLRDAITDRQVELGISDNRRCNRGHSKVHKLICGHDVYCETSTMCGRNCEEASESYDNAPLYCLLCVRDQLARKRKQFPKRWHDLLLPAFHDPGGEAKDMEEYALITRKTEPVYLDVNEVVLLPKSPTLIALIRVVEWQREKQLEGRIEEVCASEGYPQQISTMAVDNVEVLLRNHHLLHYTDLAIVAAISLKLTLSFEHIEVPFGTFSQLFDAPRDMNLGSHQRESRIILTHLVAQEKIQVFLKKVPHKYRHNNRFKKDSVDIAARRIRAQALKHLKYTPQQREELFDYIIAASIQQAMAQYQIRITMKEVCETMGITYEGSLDDEDTTHRGGKARPTRVVRQPKASTGNRTSKADIAERAIRQFTAARDWKKPTGTVKDEREKIKEAKARAERETKEIDQAMAAF